MNLFVVVKHSSNTCGWPTDDVTGIYDTLDKASDAVKQTDSDDVNEYELNGKYVREHMLNGAWLSDEGRKYYERH